MEQAGSKNLRKRARGNQSKWTEEQVGAGLEYFKKLHGKYPSSFEIDAFDYLPSARSIQRSLGGLEGLRTRLGFDLSQTNLTKGAVRSSKAKEIYAKAVNYEEAFYNFLISKTTEVNVHEHKILRPGHVCCDFFIYTSPTNGFAIDTFYAQDRLTLARIVNIKLPRYIKLGCNVFFVLIGNPEIGQEEIDKTVLMRKIAFPAHIKVMTEKIFKDNLNQLLKSV